MQRSHSGREPESGGPRGAEPAAAPAGTGPAVRDEGLPEGVEHPRDVDRIDEQGTRIIDLAELERRGAAPAWTIDLSGTASEDRRRVAAHRRQLRIWQSISVLAVALAVAAGVVAGVTARRGEQWRQIAVEQRDRATALRAQVQDATAAVVAAEEVARAADIARREAEAARDAADGQLGARQQDVVALEERVAALAAEKARLEDRLVVAGDSRRLTSSADSALVSCVQQVESWLARAPATPTADDGTAPAPDVDALAAWSSEAPAWRASCAEALAAARG